MFSSSGKAQAPVPKIQMVLDGKDARVSYQDESALFSKKVSLNTTPASQLSRSICHYLFDWSPCILSSLPFRHLNSLDCIQTVQQVRTIWKTTQLQFYFFRHPDCSQSAGTPMQGGTRVHKKDTTQRFGSCLAINSRHKNATDTSEPGKWELQGIPDSHNRDKAEV